MANIWNLLLAALVWVIRTIVLPLFPAASQGPAISFAAPMVQGFVLFLELSYVYFSMFNLYFFGAFLILLITLSAYKAVVSIFAFIVNLIKMALVFVGKF